MHRAFLVWNIIAIAAVAPPIATRSLGGATAMVKRKKLPATLSDQLRERIRLWTEENDVSLYELATHAGIHRSVLCRFVAGNQNINLTTADRLAAVLRVRLADD